jgi:TonB-dependent receptor-like protein
MLFTKQLCFTNNTARVRRRTHGLRSPRSARAGFTARAVIVGTAAAVEGDIVPFTRPPEKPTTMSRPARSGLHRFASLPLLPSLTFFAVCFCAGTAYAQPDAGTDSAASVDASAPETSTTQNVPTDAAASDGQATPVKAAPPSAQEQQTNLSAVVVTGKATTRTVLPTRPSNSAYGFDTRVVDTPRAISQVSTQQISSDPIRTADDLVKYAPGITRGGGQNVNIAPIIRGQASEIFQDDQRIYNVRHPTNFNSYEGADIVAGAPPALFGPTAASGGYINYLTKKPNFDKTETQISDLFGSWVPGTSNSYGTERLTIDTTGPVNDKFAYRVSVTNQKANDYYDNVKNDFEAYYAAITWRPVPALSVELNSSYDDYYNFNITHGWNRVTQQLVDSYGKQYDAGRATPIISSPGAGYWSPVYASGAANSAVVGWQTRTKNAKGQFVATGPVQTTPLPDSTAATAGTIQGWVYDPSIPGNSVESLSPAEAGRSQDYNWAKRFMAQSRVNLKLSPYAKIVNRTLVSRSSDHTDSLGSFLATFSDNMVDNRTEVLLDHTFQPFGHALRHQSNTGLIVRREAFATESANNSFNDNPYDLTQDPSYKTPGYLLGLPTPAGSGSWIGQAGVPQHSSYFGYLNLPPMYPLSNGLYAEAGGSPPGASYTAIGAWTTTTLYTQQNFTLDHLAGLNLGGSRSYISANIANPIAPTPAQDHSDAGDYRLYGLQASPYIKPTPDTTVYVTYDRSRAINTGGFANVLTWGNNNKLNPLSFRSLSTFAEGGVKSDLIPARLFASFTGYWQSRDTAPDTNGNMAHLITKGLESAIRYQPTRAWSAALNLSYISAHYDSIIPSGFSPFGFYADNATVWGDSNKLNARPAGAYDAAGIPSYSATGYVDYKTDFGLGAEAAFWWTSGWYTNLSYTVRVPAEYNVDLRVYYHRPTWDAAIDFLNLTDQQNFVNALPGSTSEFLQPTRPLSIQGQLAYRF